MTHTHLAVTHMASTYLTTAPMYDNNSHTSLFDRDTHDTHIIDSDTHDTHILDRDTHDTHILDNDTHDTHILDSDTHGAHILDSCMITHTLHFLTRAHTHFTQSGTHSTYVHIFPFDINQISNQPFWQTVASHKKRRLCQTQWSLFRNTRMKIALEPKCSPIIYSLLPSPSKKGNSPIL